MTTIGEMPFEQIANAKDRDICVYKDSNKHLVLLYMPEPIATIAMTLSDVREFIRLLSEAADQLDPGGETNVHQ